jgi:subtilisin family serine protease
VNTSKAGTGSRSLPLASRPFHTAAAGLAVAIIMNAGNIGFDQITPRISAAEITSQNTGQH